MQITDYILHRFREAEGLRLLVGICGRAGAGKTTLVQKISDDLTAAHVENAAYSGDWRFILDSEGRRELLREKWLAGINAYLNAINQFNWWDFGAIFKDLTAFKNGQAVHIPNAYDRLTGGKTADVTLPPMKHGVILYENCILGNLDTLPTLDIIIIVNTPDHVCLERTLRKDSKRRSVPDIATRFLITTYSENIFLRTCRERFSDRLVACDSEGQLGVYPDFSDVTHIPVPIYVRKPEPIRKGTIFCDLDGTLVKHVPVPSPTGDDLELIEGSVEKLKKFRSQGYMVILTTSRTQSNISGVLNKLRTLGVEFDQLICDLPIGPRHLINDSKNNEIRAIAHSLTRDLGLKDVEIS
ncbi:MAG TPA: HAD hydrolase family protein [Pirellulales bacterium]|nr:HAD hydrolase family protein [Pirellulales bacterium]